MIAPSLQTNSPILTDVTRENLLLLEVNTTKKNKLNQVIALWQDQQKARENAKQMLFQLTENLQKAHQDKDNILQCLLVKKVLFKEAQIMNDDDVISIISSVEACNQSIKSIQSSIESIEKILQDVDLIKDRIISELIELAK